MDIGNRPSFTFGNAKTCKNLIFPIVIEIPYSLFAGNISTADITRPLGAGDFVPRCIIAFL